MWLDQVRHTCVCHEKHRLCVPCLLSGVADAVPRALAWILLGMKGGFPSHFIWMLSAGSAHAGQELSHPHQPDCGNVCSGPIHIHVCIYYRHSLRGKLHGHNTHVYKHTPGVLMCSTAGINRALKILCCDPISIWTLSSDTKSFAPGLILWVSHLKNVVFSTKVLQVDGAFKAENVPDQLLIG